MNANTRKSPPLLARRPSAWLQSGCAVLGLMLLTACTDNDASQPFMVPERASLLKLPVDVASDEPDVLTASSACAASMLKAYAQGVRSLTVEPPDQSGPMAWPETQPVSRRGCDREPSPAQLFTAAPAKQV